MALKPVIFACLQNYWAHTVITHNMQFAFSLHIAVCVVAVAADERNQVV